MEEFVSDIVDIEPILSLVEKNAQISDIHISAGDSISYRYNGDIIKDTQLGAISQESAELMLKQLMMSNPERYDTFLGNKDADFAFVSKSNTPYRVNAYIKTSKLGFVMRKINSVARKLEDLMFHDIAQSIKQNVLTAKKGLYLVTGPTGSGKSTSLVSMLEYINQTRNENIITIEDPIEYIFSPAKCIISQREVGQDTWSFKNALRGAMRQDPDIIFVGEIRDLDTAEATLSLAETGHLVFSTLHTNSAANTINRFMSFFPPDIQDSIAARLAESLLGVQSQFLVKNKAGNGRVGIYEIMLNTTSIKNNIKKKEIPQIDNIIDTSSLVGMISLKRYAKSMIAQGIITPEAVQGLIKDTQT